MAPNDWRFCFIRYYKPETSEQRLICEILSTFFQDVDLVAFRKKLTHAEKRKREKGHMVRIGMLPMTLEKIVHTATNEQTMEYCDMLDFNHSQFVSMLNKYMQYRLGFNLNSLQKPMP